MKLVKCELCDGNGYTSKVVHPDGSATFGMCPCTGITKESMLALRESILENGGEMTTHFNSEQESK